MSVFRRCEAVEGVGERDETGVLLQESLGRQRIMAAVYSHVFLDIRLTLVSQNQLTLSS